MIEIYDTTLRDGTQRKDVSLSCNDKINIARRLDKIGIAFIEGGWPGSNPKDVEFFERASKIKWNNAKIAAFGSTCLAKNAPSEDNNILALVNAGTEYCTIFGKSTVLHVKDVLRTTTANNLRMIEESVAYLVSKGKKVVFDGEHFFDGYKLDADYAIETLRAAVRGGAETVVLCDTNGGCTPWEVSEIVRVVRVAITVPIGIHTHNDSDCAVANTLAAVREGCTHVQGTINGYGERCGNANLCTIIPNLELKMGLKTLPDGNLEGLFDLSHYVAEVANLAPDENMAYVGGAAFIHKAGTHVAAMRRNSSAYQHIEPDLVGNKMEVVISELSGRGNLFNKAEMFGIQMGHDKAAAELLDRIKMLEARGFSFEAAEASVIMMLKRQEPGYAPPFEVIDFSAIVEQRKGVSIFTEATVKVRTNGEVIHTAADGNGPVNALDYALRKALAAKFPVINHFHLSDYKVRILDGNNGTSAMTRVLIETKNGTKTWNTVGASTNIIEASWQALIDSVEYGLTVAK